MTDTAVWRDLVTTLYAAVTDPDGAGNRLPHLISRWTGGDIAATWTVDDRLRPSGAVLTNGAPEAAALYGTHYYLHDPWRPRFLADRSGRVIRGSETVEDGVLERSVYYNEFGRLHGTFHLMNSTFDLAAVDGTPFGTASTTSVMRPRAAGGFTGAETHRFGMLVPHLRQAMTLRAQVVGALDAARCGTVRATVDAITLPACALHGDGVVFHANPAAIRWDRDNAGLVLGRDGGTMRLRVQRDLDAFRAALAGAASGGPGATLLLDLGGERRVQATVTPIHGDEVPRHGRRPGLALMVLRPFGAAAAAVLEPLTMDLLGFTAAEASVAAGLAAGHTPQSIADARGVRISTVRTLLERAQAKAGAGDLRHLVAVLASLSR